MRISDWSSDVCSSDLHRREIRVADRSRRLHQVDAELGDRLTLVGADDLRHRALRPRRLAARQGGHRPEAGIFQALLLHVPVSELVADQGGADRRAVLQLALTSEERRVVKGGVRTCRSRWWPYH